VERYLNDGTSRFDEAGNLWVELYKEDTTKEFTYDVFSPEGIYLKQVRTDQRIFQFKNGRVYSIVRPEDGYPSIKRFVMELVAEYPLCQLIIFVTAFKINSLLDSSKNGILYSVITVFRPILPIYSMRK